MKSGTESIVQKVAIRTNAIQLANEVPVVNRPILTIHLSVALRQLVRRWKKQMRVGNAIRIPETTDEAEVHADTLGGQKWNPVMHEITTHLKQQEDMGHTSIAAG